MSALAFIKQFTRAVMHELYRVRYKYLIISFLVLLGSGLSVFFIEERYESSFALTVNPELYDSQSAEIKLNQLYSRLNARSETDSASGLEASREDNRLLLRYSNKNAESAYDRAMKQALEITNDPAINQQLSEITNALSFEKNELTKLKELQLVVENDIQTRNALGDTGDNSIQNRIYDVQSQLDNAQISYNVVTTKLTNLNKQLKSEAQFLSNINQVQKLKQSLAILDKKINEKQTIVDEYKDNAPSSFEDETIVISAVVEDLELLKVERNTLVTQIESLEKDDQNFLFDDVNSKNLYSELRTQIAMTEIEKSSLASRVQSLKTNLELLKSKGLNQVEIQRELSALKIKENSINADINKAQDHINKLEIKQAELNKQTSTFILINQPYKAKKYSGLGKIEVLFGGYLAFILIPLSLSVCVVFFDTKIRTDRALKNILPNRVPILETIPHFSSPKTARSVRKAYFSIAIWLISVVVIYTAIGSFGVNI